jgi:SAM-dependent methyltransferase
MRRRTTFLGRTLDPWIEQAVRFGAPFLPRDPIRRALAGERREAQRRTTRELSAAAAALGEGVVARDPEAIARFDALASLAVSAMRAARTDRGRPDRAALLAALERPLHRDAPERIDDPAFPEAERAEGMETLHRLTFYSGGYDAFLDAVRPLLDRAATRMEAAGPPAGTSAPRGRRPVRVHDLAAGHGGFAVLLKQRLGDRVAVEASDLAPSSLALGRERARAAEVAVDFHVADALSLDAIRARGVDVLTCTQALHHFPPGRVARMMGEAARAATTGFVFVDGERSWLSLAVMAPLALLYGRSPAFVHDALVSIRRLYYEEELGLLAALAPGMPPGRIETAALRPAHAYVRFTRAPA